MDVREAIGVMRNRLPLERQGRPFVDTLKSEFNVYIALLEQTEMEDADLNESCIRYAKPKPTKRRFISLVKMIQDTIIEIIQSYYDGYPGTAYKELLALLNHNRLIGRGYRGNKSYHYYKLDDTLSNSFSREMLKDETFYRMRISKNELHEKCELFHLPYTKRELVKSYRFSIQGFPCLYLGTSLDVCWKEIGRDKPDGKVYASRFENDEPLVFIDLTIPNIDSDSEMYDAYQFLVTYPFYLASLTKVEFPESPFKPEYIIPQLLLQYVKAEERLDGIIYSSTKDNEHKNDRYHNIVIPTKNYDNNEFCTDIVGKFSLSEIIHIDNITKMKMDEMEQMLNNRPVSKLDI
jgi:hypothetical protein